MESTTAIEHEIKVTPSASVQIKLLSSLQSQKLDDVVRTLKGVLGFGDFAVTTENVRNVTDDYYDTDDLSLYSTHSLLRVRRQGSSPTIVVKTLIGQSPGELKRTEFEQATSEDELQSLIESSFASIVAAQLPDLKGKKLTYKVKVSNERRNYLMVRGEEIHRLSFDSFFFVNPKTGRTSDQQYEIEIESLNAAASAKLHTMKHSLLEVFRGGFTFSKSSKYERGIEAFSINGALWKQWLSKWSSPTGLGWVGFVATLAGIVIGVIATVISTWITLRAG